MSSIVQSSNRGSVLTGGAWASVCGLRFICLSLSCLRAMLAICDYSAGKIMIYVAKY
jgi:hypothetical protein